MKIQFPSLAEQIDVIKLGAAEVLPEQELSQKIERSIASGKPLSIKLGCDPSRPDLHVGHAVVLHKLREFQELGHDAVLIVGDFTAMIGDPTGKSKTRPALTLKETREHGQTYLDQAGKILDVGRTKIVYNSEWLSPMNFADVIALSARYTVSQMLEREDFHQRFNNEQPISLHELLYPLAQGMDSVHLQCDVEIGGTDQKFNFLVARELQRSYGVEPQAIVTMPILEGIDGVEKMSKSLGNYIALTDSPREIFGKTMSIPDNLLLKYMQLATFSSADEIVATKKGIDDGTLHPRTAKVNLAKRLTAIYWNEDAAISAFDEFERMFVRKEMPDNIEEQEFISENANPLVVDVLFGVGLAASKSEARRLIQGGGVSVDGEKIIEISSTVNLQEKTLFKVGKRKFLYVHLRQ